MASAISGSRFGSKESAGILGDDLFDGFERMPEQPLVLPLIPVIVMSLGIGDVADREFDGLLEGVVMVPRPRVERAAIVDLATPRLAALVHPRIPFRRQVVVAIGNEA